MESPVRISKMCGSGGRNVENGARRNCVGRVEEVKCIQSNRGGEIRKLSLVSFQK